MGASLRIYGAQAVIRAVLLAFVVFVLMLGAIVHRADGATLSGAFTYSPCYADADPNATPPKPCTPLTQADIKHTQVEVGTCSSVNTTTGTGVFGTKEGEQLVAPPATAWSVTVSRTWGNFCARARHVSQGGSLGQYNTGTFVARIEPPPGAPGTVTIATVAYEVLSHPLEGTRLGRNVGTVPLGTKCDEEVAVYTSAGEYHGVPLESVTLTKAPKSGRVVARCEAAG